MTRIFPLIVLITLIIKCDTSQPRQIGGWVSDGSKAIDIRNNILSCNPTISSSSTSSEDNEYRGMWVDGPGINSGEHFWTIKFTHLEKPSSSLHGASVGLSNWSLFHHGQTGQGLFYSLGDLKSSGGDEKLVEKFGPTISEGDTLGIFAAFSEEVSNLKVYLFLNGKPLGLAFEVPATALPNAYPTVSFIGCSGSAKIRRETNVPLVEYRNPQPKKYSGIEGSWRVIPKTITINGEMNAPTLRHFDTPGMVKFTSLGGNWYSGSLNVVNHMTFGVEKTRNSWKNFGSWSTIPIGFSTKFGQVERWIKMLMDNPDRVIFLGSNQLVVRKGNSRATFMRFDDTTKGFTGDPFGGMRMPIRM